MKTVSLQEQAAAFRRLHDGPGILVLPNAWDVITARVIESAGFAAIATSSAGVAWALGYADGERISRGAAHRGGATRQRLPAGRRRLPVRAARERRSDDRAARARNRWTAQHHCRSPRPGHPRARAPRGEAREPRSTRGPGGSGSGAPGRDGVARARHLRRADRPDTVHGATAPRGADPLTGSNARVYLYRSVNINAFGLMLLGGTDMSHNCSLKTVAILNPATPTDGSGRRV